MLLPKQIWKDIEGYEGLYQVSNTGKVRSMNYNKTGKVKRLKPAIDSDGYLRLGLYKDGKQRYYSVHRLVAMTFIPNPNNLPCVNHKDENKTNNCVDNLEWISHLDNMNYGTRNERLSESRKGQNNPMYGKKGKDNPTSKPILMIDKHTTKPIACFDCVGDANEYLGKPRYNSTINKCAKGYSKTSGGYIWKYVNIIAL